MSGELNSVIFRYNDIAK